MTKTVTDVESQTPETPKDGTNTVRYVLFALIALGAIAGVVILIYAFTATSPEKQASNAWEQDGTYKDVTTILKEDWNAAVKTGEYAIASTNEEVTTTVKNDDGEEETRTSTVTTAYIGTVHITDDDDKTMTIKPAHTFEDGTQVPNTTEPVTITEAYKFNSDKSLLVQGTKVTFKKDEENKEGTITAFPKGGDAHGTILVTCMEKDADAEDGSEKQVRYAVDSTLLTAAVPTPAPVVDPTQRVADIRVDPVPSDKTNSGNGGFQPTGPNKRPGKTPGKVPVVPADPTPAKTPAKVSTDQERKTIAGLETLEKFWGCALGFKDDCTATVFAKDGDSTWNFNAFKNKGGEVWKRTLANFMAVPSKGMEIGCAIKDDVCRHKNKLALAMLLDFIGALDQVPYFGQHLSGTFDRGFGYDKFYDFNGKDGVLGNSVFSEIWKDASALPGKARGVTLDGTLETATDFVTKKYLGIGPAFNLAKDLVVKPTTALVMGTKEMVTDAGSLVGLGGVNICKPGETSGCIQKTKICATKGESDCVTNEQVTAFNKKLVQDTANKRNGLISGGINLLSVGNLGNAELCEADYTVNNVDVPQDFQQCAADKAAGSTT
jgi:hypothetical protein